MKIKNRSGKSPLLALYKKKTSLFYKIGVLFIFISELCVMYIIQNNFGSVKLQALGLLLLALSLLVSSLSLSAVLRRARSKHK